MRVLALSVIVASGVLTGCSALAPLWGAHVPPADRKASFEEAQQAYTSSLRRGSYDDARPFVEPELQDHFDAARAQLSELGLSEYRVESLEIDPLRTSARAVVVFRVQSPNAPYVREWRSVQHWRRELPSRDWYVTPDFEALPSPAWAGGGQVPPVAAPAPLLR